MLTHQEHPKYCDSEQQYDQLNIDFETLHASLLLYRAAYVSNNRMQDRGEIF